MILCEMNNVGGLTIPGLNILQTQKAPCKLPREGSNQQPSPVMMPLNHNSDQHGHKSPKRTVVTPICWQ